MSTTKVEKKGWQVKFDQWIEMAQNEPNMKMRLEYLMMAARSIPRSDGSFP